MAWKSRGEERSVSHSTFSQIVALMIPRRSVVVGFLLVAILFPPLFAMKLALSPKEESQRTFQGGTKQRPWPACREDEAAGVTVLLARAVRLEGVAGRPATTKRPTTSKRVGIPNWTLKVEPRGVS